MDKNYNITCSICKSPVKVSDEFLISIPKHISKEISASGYSHYYCLFKYTNDLEYSKKTINYSIEDINLNIDNSIRNYFQKLSKSPLKILVVGFGIGFEIFYLSTNYFDVTGIDISSKAKELVSNNLKNLNLNVVLYTDNILTFSDPKYIGYFDFVVDRFVFQNIPIKLRRVYSKKIASLMKEDGKLLLKCLNSEKFKIKEGPPYTISKRELKTSFEEDYNIKFINNDTKNGYINLKNQELSYYFCCFQKKKL